MPFVIFDHIWNGWIAYFTQDSQRIRQLLINLFITEIPYEALPNKPNEHLKAMPSYSSHNNVSALLQPYQLRGLS